jgi:peptide deformylase
MLKIITAPHATLATVAEPINKIDNDMRNLITEMVTTLENAKDPEGVGLAAPQVNKSLSLFIVKEDKKSPLKVFINPKITYPEGINLMEEIKRDKKKKKSVKLEGCLSLNNIWGVVKRYPSVLLTYQDENGIEHTEKFTGFLATIIQHEVDHLNGILFPKRVLEQNGQLYKSSKDKKGETVFEEIKI